MSIAQLVIGWFYYGIFYMGMSIFATAVINRAVKRYMTAPLLINAFGITALLLLFRFTVMTPDQFWYYLLFVYMPIVAASFAHNIILAVMNKRNPFGLMPEKTEFFQPTKMRQREKEVMRYK